jgi:hypothetical protein
MQLPCLVLAHTLASPRLGRKPKARVTIVVEKQLEQVPASTPMEEEEL